MQNIMKSKKAFILNVFKTFLAREMTPPYYKYTNVDKFLKFDHVFKIYSQLY